MDQLKSSAGQCELEVSQAYSQELFEAGAKNGVAGGSWASLDVSLRTSPHRVIKWVNLGLLTAW